MPCRRTVFSIVAILTTMIGCSNRTASQSSNKVGAKVQAPSSREVNINPANEFGYSKISVREGETYQEGIVDAQGNEVVQKNSNILVNDITGKLALVQMANKFLFVPLDGGFVSLEDLESVNGFQYAEPFSCGHALVSVDDVRFYIDAQFKKAFDLTFEFAESFHHDRALVSSGGRYRIIHTSGKTVADLNYHQVNPQSPWCWQVTQIDKETFLSGFVDLDGNLITDLIYEEVSYYAPDVRRIWVSSKSRYGFLDEYAKVAIPVKYEYAEIFNHGKAKVVLEGRTFFIDPDGIEVRE